MRKFPIKDKRYRHNFCKVELNRFCLNTLLNSDRYTKEQKQYLMSMRVNKKLKSITSLTRVRNGCVNTGRTGSVSRITRLSRMQFKNLASNGLLVGFNKASW